MQTPSANNISSTQTVAWLPLTNEMELGELYLLVLSTYKSIGAWNWPGMIVLIIADLPLIMAR